MFMSIHRTLFGHPSRSWMPVQGQQGHNCLFFMLPALNNLRTCFLEVISSRSLKGTLRGPSSNYSSPWMAKKRFALTGLSGPGCPMTLPASGSLGVRQRLCWDRFPSYRSRPCQHTPHFSVMQENKAQSSIPKPSVREHSWLDSSHPQKQTCRSVSHFWVPTVSSCFPPSKCQIEGKVSCKDKKMHLQKLRRPALKIQPP